MPGGYHEKLTFDLRPFANSISERAENSFLPLTLRVIDKTKDSAKIISTAVSAKGVPLRGGILLTSWKSSPTLSTVNVRDGNVHPLVFDF